MCVGCWFEPLLAITCGRHFGIRLSIYASVCDCMLKVCEHDILQTTCWNFTKFTAYMHLGRKMNWLHFEAKRSKFNITTRPKMVKNHLFKKWPFRQRHTGQWYSVKDRLVCSKAVNKTLTGMSACEGEEEVAKAEKRYIERWRKEDIFRGLCLVLLLFSLQICLYFTA